MTWVCGECTTAYAVGLPACPHCGTESSFEEGSVPKIHADRGPTYDPAVSETVAAPVEWSPGSTLHVPAGPGGAETTVEVTGAVVGDAGPELVVPLNAAPAYAEMTVAQLQAELERLGLPKSGNKRDLIERLEEDDRGEASA
jgi:hypothetical protein